MGRVESRRLVELSFTGHGFGSERRVLRDAIIWCDSRGVPYGEKAFGDLGADSVLPRLLNSPGNFTVLACFIPMSPRYLAMKGLDRPALHVLARINGAKKAREILDNIKQSDNVASTRLFPFGIMVVFVGVMLSVFQQTVGINAVLYYAPRIFESMGMGNPMVQTVVMGVVNITFTLVAIFTVEKLGRKPLLITGSIGMGPGAFGVALSNIFAVSSTFVPIYNMQLGSMGDKFGHMFVYLLYGAICIVAAWFVWRLVPETKGKTLEDITRLWQNRRK